MLRRMSTSNEALEARLVELELRYTQQQAELHELSDVVWQQAKAIERLEAEVRELRRYLSSEPWSGDGIPHERPPHY